MHFIYYVVLLSYAASFHAGFEPLSLLDFAIRYRYRHIFSPRHFIFARRRHDDAAATLVFFFFLSFSYAPLMITYSFATPPITNTFTHMSYYLLIRRHIFISYSSPYFSRY